MSNLIIVPLNTELPRRSLHHIAGRIDDAFGGAYARVDIHDAVHIDPATHPERRRLFFPTPQGFAVQCSSKGINALLYTQLIASERWANDVLVITDMQLYQEVGGSHRTIPGSDGRSVGRSVITTFEHYQAWHHAVPNSLRDLETRLAKLGTHEVGHKYIVAHHDPCAMKGIPGNIGNNDYRDIVRAVDAMPEEFCQPCKAVIAESASINLGQRV
ncbi:hypothetical protein HYS47_05070 [Candidatus Woesearchaeota archaeon]|nr:hypothetical protein [Candidatus Woesearchaeota archaeon]